MGVGATGTPRREATQEDQSTRGERERRSHFCATSALHRVLLGLLGDGSPQEVSLAHN